MGKIFGYENFPSCNLFVDNPLGFKVEIYGDDIPCLIYQVIAFRGGCVEEKIYELPIDIIRKIKKVIADTTELAGVNPNLNNGSFDGCGNRFYFNDGEREYNILAWNIDLIRDSDAINPDYLEEYRENIRQEHIVCELFDKIKYILREEKLILELYDFETDNEH